MQVDRWLSFLSRRWLAGWPAMRGLLQRWRRSCARRYAGRPERWVTIRDYDGDLLLHLDRSSYLGGALYWHGYHHRRELAYLDRRLAPGMGFVDVGANQGEFTLFAAKRLPHGRVVAFEPENRMFGLLARNVEANRFKQVALVQAGLGAAPSQARLYTSPEESAEGWNEGLFSAFRNETRREFVQEFEIRRLDDVVAELSLDRVDVIKVDVEGAELHVLRGGEAMVERHRPDLLLEVGEQAFQDAGYTARDLEAWLAARDYRSFRFLKRGRLRPTGFVEAARSAPSLNLLCLHASNASSAAASSAPGATARA